MKKFFIIVLLAIMAITLSACSGSEKINETPGLDPGPKLEEIVVEEIVITPITIE